MQTKLSDEDLQDIYQWVDKIPLSRPKRNITRDFSDGVLFAEIISHYHPKLIEIHNYSNANSYTQKIYNWNTLVKKVLKKLHFTLSKDDIQAVANCKPNVIERLLLRLRSKLASYRGNSNPVEKKRTYSNNAPSPFAHRKTPGINVGEDTPPQKSSYSSSYPVDRDEDIYDLRPPQFHRGDSRNESVLTEEDGDLQALLHEKDQTILELRDTISILDLKIKKLEQLVQLKDSKIAALQQN